MFIKISHQNFPVYISSKNLATECYKITENFPGTEKFALVQQIRRAAVSVVLNIVEGLSRRSNQERKRYFEISRGSIIEIDAAFEISQTMGYLKSMNSNTKIESSMNETFAQLSGLIKALEN